MIHLAVTPWIILLPPGSDPVDDSSLCQISGPCFPLNILSKHPVDMLVVEPISSKHPMDMLSVEPKNKAQHVSWSELGDDTRFKDGNAMNVGGAILVVRL